MRWWSRKDKEVPTPKIDAFLLEVDAVCRKHGFSIGHEDGHGAFIVENYSEGDFAWLNAAHVAEDVQAR